MSHKFFPKNKLTPMVISLITTTFISGIALVYAWTGPTASPFGNNVTVPINAGASPQTKSSSLTTTGLGSAGNLIVTGFTTLGAATAPRNALEVNGNISNTAALNANPNLLGYNVGVGSVGAETLYGYNAICVGNGSGACTSSGGVVIGPVNNNAVVNITGNGGLLLPQLNIRADNSSNATRPYTRGGLDHFVLAPAQDRTAGPDTNTFYLAFPGDLPSNDTVATRIQETLYISPTNNLGGGRVGVGVLSPVGKFQVQTLNDTTPSTVSSWDDRHTVFGQGNTGGIGLSYNSTAGYGIINALSPSVAWRNLVLQSGGGNVGIGTTTPSDKLAVIGAITTNNYIHIDSWVGYGTGRGSIWYDGAGGAGDSTGLLSFGHDGNTGMVLNRLNNVGIGTTTPSSKLSVVGEIYSGSGGFRFPDGSLQTTAASGGGQWTTSGANIFNSNTGNVGIGVNPLSKLHIANNVATGALDTYGEYQMLLYSTGVPVDSYGLGIRPATMVFNSDLNYEFDSSGSTKMGLYDGNLNIGTNNNLARLTVQASPGQTAFLAQSGSNGNNFFIDYVGGGANYLRGDTFFNARLYDEFNTSYYLDPGSTTVLNSLGVGAEPAPTDRLVVLASAGQTAFLARSATGGNNLYIDYLGGGNNYLRGNTIFNGALFDENNTSYYLDPAATTALNTVTTTGYVGIGTNAPIRPLHVNGELSLTSSNNTTYFNVSNTTGNGGGTIVMRGLTNGGATQTDATVSIIGALFATQSVTANSFIYSSDKTLKKNITPLNNSLAKIQALKGYSFNWKDTNIADIGIIAQEVESVFPALVHTNPTTGLKSVEYANLVAPLIEAVKELANMLDGLSQRVFNTETRQTQLEKQVQAQQAQIDSLQRQIAELSKKK